jgi:hypothetical protein
MKKGQHLWNSIMAKSFGRLIKGKLGFAYNLNSNEIVGCKLFLMSDKEFDEIMKRCK